MNNVTSFKIFVLVNLLMVVLVLNVAAQTYNMPSSSSYTYSTCSGLLYDNGGTGNYTNSVNGTLTLNPSTAGSMIRLVFYEFNTESCCDQLSIYDGTSTSSTLIGNYAGTNIPSVITATNSSGSITLKWVTDPTITSTGFLASISCVSNSNLPDLQIQLPYLSSYTASPGASVSAYSYIYNAGQSAALSSDVGYYFSTDSVYDISDTYLGNITGSSLNPVTSSSRSKTLVLPTGLSNGKYYIIWFADHMHTVTESKENNNIEVLPIQIYNSTMLDLSMKNVTVPANTYRGSAITLSGTVYNNSASTANSVGVISFLSNDNIIDAGDVLLGSTTINALGNYATSFSISATIPQAQSPNMYYVLVAVDYNNTINEYNEENNTCFYSMVVMNKTVDLVFSSLGLNSTPIELTPGCTVSGTGNLANSGNQVASSQQMGIYLSSDSILSGNDVLIYSSTFNLSANYSYTSSFSGIIPGTVTPGSYFLIGKVDNTDIINETNENNNITFFPINIVAATKEISISSATLPYNLNIIPVGTSMTSNIYTINNGNVTSNSFYTFVYFSSDSIWDAGDQLLNSYLFSSGISAYSVSTAAVAVTIPSSASYGLNYLIYKADANNEVIEVNENNNTLILPVNIVPFNGIDIVAKGIALTYNPYYPGITLPITYSTFNNSPVNASSIYTGFYLSTDSIFDFSDIYLVSSSQSLNANTISKTSLNITIPSNTLDGNYYIIQYSDYNSSISEANELNNWVSNPIKISVSSSIYNVPVNGNNVVTACSGTICDAGGTGGYYLPNSDGSLTVQPQNIGDKCQLFFSYYSVYSSGDTLFIYDGLDVNSPLIGTYTNLPPSFVTATNPEGALTVRFRSNEITEYGGFTAFISCVNIPSMTDILINKSTYFANVNYLNAGESVMVNSIFTNRGRKMDNSTMIGYFLSTDSIYDLSDILLYSNSFSALNVNQSTSYLNTIIIPTNVSQGSYYLITYADYANAITEINEINNYGSILLNVQACKIDLVSLKPYFSPPIVTPGINQTLYYTLANNSNALLTNIGTNYYLSTDTMVDAFDVVLGTSSVASVGAGVSSTQSVSFTLNSNTIPGNYYYLYYADYLNSVSEVKESNNISYKPVMVLNNKPDLRIVAQYISTNILGAGSVYAAYCNIVNASASVATSSSVGYYLSTDSILDVSDIILGNANGTTLSPNNYSSRSSNITIPLTTPTGVYYILYVADFNGLVNEINEANNTASFKVNIISNGADLTLASSIPTVVDITPGSSFNLYTNVINDGSLNVGNTSLEFFLSSDTIYQLADIYLGTTGSFSLNSFTALNKSASLIIPSNTTSGNYYLLIFADRNNFIDETNELNNLDFYPVYVKQVINDISVSDPVFSSFNLVSGVSTNLTFEAYNFGNVVSTANATGFYLSTDSLFDAGDVYLGLYSSSTINAFSTATRSYSLLIPGSTSPGIYYILNYIDYSNITIEDYENNNIGSVRVNIVSPQLDISLGQISISTVNLISGSSYSTYGYVYNVGNVPTSTTSYVGYYLSTDSIFDVTDVYLNSTVFSSIAVNGSSYFSSSLAIPISTLPGSYYLLYYGDYNGTLNEINESNNIKVKLITIASPVVDLAITNQNVSSINMISGYNYSVSGYIYNYGNVASGSFVTGYYLSTDTVFDVSDILLTTGSYSSISGGSYSTISSTINISNGIFGTYYVLFYADNNNLINESNESNNVKWVQVNIQLPNYDVAVTNQSTSTTTMIAGNTYTASAYVYNYGNLPTGTFSTGFYLSTDTLFDISDVYLVNNNHSSIAVNSYNNISKSIQIPVSTSAGIYYIIYYADNLNGLNESNESNNIKWKPITVQEPYFDVALTNQTVSQTVLVAGNTYSLTSYVYNYGNVSTGAFTTGFYLSTDTLFDVSDDYLTNYSHSSISAGSSNYISKSFTIPGSVSAGNYYILYYADNLNGLNEINESNNIKWKLVTVQAQYYDVAITNQTVSQTSLIPGNSYSLTTYVYNYGNVVSGIFTTGFYLSTDTLFDVSDVFLTNYSHSSISAGYSNYISKSFTIPVSTPVGSYYILYYADNLNSLNEINESNNIKWKSVSVQLPFVDLAVNNQTVSQTNLVVGYTYSLSTYVYNFGNTISGAFTTGFYISLDTLFDVSDVYLTNYSHSNISPSSSNYISKSFTVPVSTPAGSYYLLYYADNLSSISEPNEINNIKWIQVSIQNPAIDLAVSNQNISNSIVFPGFSYNVSGRISNLGNINSGTSATGYYISNDTIFDASDVFITNSSVPSMSGGYYYDFSYPITIPSWYISGNYYIIIYSDYQGYISEPNEVNNIRYIPISIQLPYVDMIVTTPTVSNSTMYTGSLYTITGYFKNIGNYTSASSYGGFYLSLDTIYDGSDIYLTNTFCGGLSPNQTLYFSKSITIPTSITLGNWYVLYYADYQNMISESNENNNVNYYPVTITSALPDQTIISQSFVSPVAMGTTGSCNVTVLNSGNVSCVSSSLGIYLSADEVLDINDIYLNYTIIPVLSVGNSYNSNVSITIPGNLSPGIYYLIGMADNLQSINEINENNNHFILELLIGNSGKDLVNRSCSINSNTLYPDTVYSVNGMLCNFGINSCNMLPETGFYLSSDTIVDAGDLLIGSTSLSQFFYPVDTAFYTENITLPSNTNIGNYYLIFFADYNDVENESNENNNVFYIPISVINIESIVIVPKISDLISLYPNPSNTFTRLYYSGTNNGRLINVELYTADGKKLFVKEWNVGDFIEFDVRPLPAGIYYFKIYFDKGSLFKEFLKTY